MKKSGFLILALIPLFLTAQKTEQGFDYAFKPTTDAPRFLVVTEKKQSVWHREAFYLPERSQAMEGSFEDRDCTKPIGVIAWYYPNKMIKSEQLFTDGMKNGPSLFYDEQGILIDSSFFLNGKVKGIKKHWYSNRAIADSALYDEQGNINQIGWYKDHTVKFVKFFSADTVKTGHWKYYHENGKVKAEIDYTNGVVNSCQCFDRAGSILDSTLCMESNATFPGGNGAWEKYCAKNMHADIMERNNTPFETYKVAVKYVIDSTGQVTEIKPLTNFGFGMEEEVIRVLKSSPKWIPAKQYGLKIEAPLQQYFVFSKQ